jgi:hypothetical protein
MTAVVVSNNKSLEKKQITEISNSGTRFSNVFQYEEEIWLCYTEYIKIHQYNA